MFGSKTRRSLFSNKFNLGRSLFIEVMPKIEKADWYFIVPATAVWALSLLVTAWDFLQLQGLVYRFGVANVVGLALFLAGIFACRRQENLGEKLLLRPESGSAEATRQARRLQVHSAPDLPRRHTLHSGNTSDIFQSIRFPGYTRFHTLPSLPNRNRGENAHSRIWK